MKRRILSLALVLAMVLSLMPVGVLAVEPEHVHCMCGQETAKDAVCKDCGTKAVAWTGVEAMPTAPGNYYLKKDVAAAPTFLTSGQYSFCLCGHDLISAAGKRIIDVAKEGTVLNLTDCAEEVGSVTGATGASATGSVLCANNGGVINFWGGKITGNTAASNGVILVATGAQFNMYGGEISKNTSGRGAIYMTEDATTVRLLGGVITENTGKNTGAMGGGAGVYGLKGTIELGGDVQIFGNTAAEASRNGDLYLRNDQGAKLTLSETKPLKTGAKVNYGTWTAGTEANNYAVTVSKEPAAWSSTWLRYNGTKLALTGTQLSADTSADHVHCLCGAVTIEGDKCAKCGAEAVIWAGTKTLPVTDGYYYLTETVKTAKVSVTGDVKLCLCGQDLESAAGDVIIKTMPGGSLTVTDCQETAGKITGTTATTAIEIQTNSAFVLWNGKITGNTGTGNGTVWIAQGTATLPGGSFTMYGGEISGNTTGRGAVFTGTTTDVKLATVRLLGGKITGNTGTNSGSGTGGGAGVYALSPVEIGGNMQIYGNTAAINHSDMYLRNDGKFTGKLIVSDEVPLTDGANVAYDLKVAETDTTDLTYVTGAPANWNNSWLSYNGQQVAYGEGKFYIPVAHVHCLCGKVTTEGSTCADCGSKAVAWTGTGALPATDGYYYLTEDVKTARVDVTGDVKLCLHGCDLESEAGAGIVKVMPAGALTLTDCSGAVGTVTGVTKAAAIEVQTNGSFILYNGRITGNTYTSNGTVWVAQGTATLAGATFNMYGGEISGNTTARGAVFVAIPSNATNKQATVRLLGGKITGNTGTNTPAGTGGGAGVYALSPVEIGGDVQIASNTAQVNGNDIYLRNDGSFTGSLVVSTEKPLTDGANVQYSLSVADPDPTDLKAITGTPDAWNKAWVTYDGESVSYEDGKFFTKVLPKHVHCLCGAETTLDATCAKCGSKAMGWIGTDRLPTKEEPGYYYLTGDVATAEVNYTNGTFAICLNGHELKSAAGSQILEAYKDATVHITDCQTTGTVTGATGKTTYGSTMRVNMGGHLILWNGKITGNTAKDDGIIYVDGSSDAAVSGGIFTMYGGQITGNTLRRGTVYGVSTGINGPVIQILGGEITGNTGTGTGNQKGGAGVYSFYPVEVGGSARIYGNTAKEGPADIYLRNDSTYTGKLIVTDLTDGASIAYTLTVADEPMDLQYITGTPASWSMEWVSYDGVKVGYEDGRFYTKYAMDYADHDHDGQKWFSVTQDNGQRPGADGFYVLETDVVLEQTIIIAKDSHVHICLNGKTLTAAEKSAHFEVQDGGKLTVCDCTAKTVDGVYTAGKITGGTGKSGGSFRVRPGGEFYLIDGIFTGNACAEGGNGGVVYADAGAYIKMTGGMMCGNTGAMGGAIRLGAPNVDGPVPTLILEGGSICHNESINMGGGVYAAGGADIQLKGGTVANNHAAEGGGGICVNSQGIQGTALVTMPSVVTLTGTTISGNTATTWGANVYIKSGTLMHMQGGIITGGYSKVGAGILMESKGTTLNLSGGKISGNTAGSAGAAAIYASNNTILNMTGGEISGNKSEGGSAGIVVYAAKASFTGGTITGNHAASGGGGLSIQGSEVYLGKIVISNNKSEGSSGGVYISRAGSVTSDVTIDGTQIINNTCKTSGGGIFLYMDGNKVTMEDGLIAGNQAADGGGVVAQRKVTFIMNGGEIRDNSVTSNGGGYYASIDSTFVMNDGKICNNYATKGGGGVYCLRSTVTLNKGLISGNKAKVSGGAVTLSGTKAKMYGGVTISNNSSEGSGSGVMIQSSTATVDGVKTIFAGEFTMFGGTITGNSTPKAGGGVLANGKNTTFNFYGGTISYNKTDKFAAGIYGGKDSVLNIYGGTVCYNESKLDAAGGIQVDGAIATFTGGEIHHNKAARSSGGVMIGREGVVRMSNVKIYENEAKVGGGLLCQGKADVILDGCQIYGNHSTTDAGGVYVSTYTLPTFKNTDFYENTCEGNGGGLWSWATSHVTLEGCSFRDNVAKGEGGGVWTRGDAFYLTDVTFEGNRAAGNGGGFGCGMMGSATPRETPGIVMDGCSFQGNTTDGIGGGMYICSGAKCRMKDTVFTGNVAQAEGGAFWAKDELTMHDVEVTGNESGGEGFAVYLDDSDYDGHSYVAGLMKMSGSMKIFDNQGGDLYLGKETAIIIGEDGLAQDTRIELVMHSGLLTDWVWGAYDYEGGDLEYTITAGDRSLTEPEQKDPPAKTGEEKDGKAASADALLYVGIGAIAVAVLAAILLVLKKRSGRKAEKANKE